MVLTTQNRIFKAQCLNLAMQHMNALKPMCTEDEFVTAVYRCAQAYCDKAKELDYFEEELRGNN